VFDLFKRIFPDKNEGGINVNDKTVPLAKVQGKKSNKVRSSGKYRVASCQSPGKARFHNEDALFSLSCELFTLDEPVYFGIFLVADGMGGHQSGEVASRLAAQAASREIMERVFNSIVYDGGSRSDDEFLKVANDAVLQAQTMIHRRVPGGGTTLTLSLIVDDQIYTAHVGDSRLYVIDKNGGLDLKTKDHSLVKRLVDLGEISAQEASTHPQRNVLYRALGQDDPLKPDLGQISLDVNEIMLICSDGLWGVVDADQIESIIKRAQTLEAATCELINAANNAGGPDNISAILVERLS